MAKGSTAKEQVSNTIIKALGSDYILTYNNKIYTWADDGGERIQIAISLTCPKTLVGVDLAEPKERSAFDNYLTDDAEKANAPVAEITDKEKETIADLMRKLGF